MRLLSAVPLYREYRRTWPKLYRRSAAQMAWAESGKIHRTRDEAREEARGNESR